MITKLCVMLAAAAAMLAAPAAAQTYVEARGGIAFADNFDIGNGAPGFADARLQADDGWLAGIAIGRHVGSTFRIELEAARRHIDAPALRGRTANANPPPAEITATVPIAGSIDVDSLMVHAYADADIAAMPALHPFAGIGAGIARVDPAPFGDSQTMPALAVSLGVAFDISDALALTLSGTLFLADEDVPVGSGIDLTVPSVQAGLRFTF